MLLATFGTAGAWRATDHAVREKTRDDALGLASFVATTFGVVEDAKPGTDARLAHRAVTNAVRSDWSALQLVTELRIIGRDGRVKWSRAIEEEDKPWGDARAVLAVDGVRTAFDENGGEVLYPLGGVACGGCHTGDSTLKAGVLQLRVPKSALRKQVGEVFSNATWFIALFLVVLTASLFLAVRRYVTRPLSRLAKVMKRAEAGDVVVRAPAGDGDELARLGTAFNRMLEHLTDFKVNEIDAQRDLEEARTALELKAEIEKRATELQLLFDLSRTIAATLDLDEVLSLVTTEVPEKLGVNHFSVMLLTADGALEVRKAHPAASGIEGMRFEVGEGVGGHAAKERALHYAPDVEKEPLFKKRGGDQKGSLLSVPMVRSGELLGVLNFERPQVNAFTPRERDLFVAVADQIGLAVQNARLHEQTVALSITDPLTGVPNRRFFYQQLNSELARAERFSTPVSMVMVDIDHFKQLNDHSGHSAGDEVLRKVAQLLRHNLRKVDTLARYGGEEFIVLLPQIGHDEAREVAEKLRRAVADTTFEQGKRQPLGIVSISVGVATLPRDANDDVKLIDAADSALYASKRGGRNRVTSYEPGMEQEPTRQRSRLARAVTGEIPAIVIKE